MTKRNLAAVGLTVVSIVLLLPGLLQPMLTITASIEFMGISQEILHETQSILQTVRRLHQSGNDFVAGLILSFSVIVPFLKGLMLPIILGIRNDSRRHKLYLLVRSLSKWSMADVFVVGVFTAMLAARATANLDAVLGVGFYWFAGYCLVSNLSFQVLKVSPPAPSGTTDSAD